MSEIRMNSEGLGNNAEQFKQYSEQFTQNLNKIKNIVESLKDSWTDAAGINFFQKFEQKYNVVKEMGPAIQTLGEAVEKTNNRLNQAIDESISSFR